MSSSAATDIDEFFINAVEKATSKGKRCSSVELGRKLRAAAVTKNGSSWNREARNLLFPPSLIRKEISITTVLSIFNCGCVFCDNRHSGNDALRNLIEMLREKDGREDLEADDKRRLLSVLAFMGAGFASRYLCTSRTKGLDIMPLEEILRKELFKPLQDQGRFQPLKDGRDVTSLFIAIFKQARKIFDTPTFKLGDYDKFMDDENLPFLNDKRLQKSKSLFTFKIHPEFCGAHIPPSLVRKEVSSPGLNYSSDEKKVLQFLAKLPQQPHLIQLKFSYRYGEFDNYVFKKYDGSLQDILDGNLVLEPQHVSKPQRYRNSKLQHWLWQGTVDIVEALAFFHAPQTFSPSLQDQFQAAHFDVKPANILVDHRGSLILTDFGDARIVQMPNKFPSSAGGDYNYKPPQKSSTMPWTQAYDVWSMACVITEVIEYIKNSDGPRGFKKFQKDRNGDNQSNFAFWTGNANNYQLRPSVITAMRNFRSPHDLYLNSVTDLLERMFSIEELKRPSMKECLTLLTEEVPEHEYPLLDEGELSILGRGTKPLLSNMLTQFERKIKNSGGLQRCKMFLLLDESMKRVRLAVQFQKNLVDGKPLLSVVSDSARYHEEEIRLLSLFDKNPPYHPKTGQPTLCDFVIMHPNLTFTFDVPMDYYDYLAAVTRQELYLLDNGTEKGKFLRMPIKRCVFQPSGAHIGDNRQPFGSGHVQIWKELSDDEYNTRFMPSEATTLLKASTFSNDKRGSTSSSNSSNKGLDRGASRTSSSLMVRPSMTGLPTLNERSTSYKKWTLPRRIVIFLPGTPCLLTINIANSRRQLDWGLDSKRRRSAQHLTINKISKVDFKIGKFESEGGVPAFPIDPKVLLSKEDVEINWIEIEFATPDGLNDLHTLCAQNESALFSP